MRTSAETPALPRRCAGSWGAVLGLALACGLPASGAPPAPAWQAAAPRVGSLRLEMAGSAHSAPQPLHTPLPAGWGLQEPKEQLGLEFRVAPRDNGARRLLLVQVSGAAALHFRPRRGGLMVTYRTEF